ncbi:MAG TPA: TetR/AcrR family transcriptional regulator [Anaerolineaceae bacterium]|nr:TetR/AcrR family transcriptional regulator [Anaerolineaceae bacterium]
MTVSPPKELDRRTRRTRRSLREALFALILEKGYEAVTIEDITERADLGRTTFYLHYRDKEDLLLEAIDTIAAELIARLPPPTRWRGTEPVENQPVVDSILIVFAHAAENAQLYRIILRGEGGTRASGRLHEIISQTALEIVEMRVQSGELHPVIPVKVYASYFAGSLLAMLTWWLEEDMPYLPERTAEMFRDLFFQGGRRMMGLEK